MHVSWVFAYIQQAFDQFDTDGSGLLDEDEFAQAMHLLGLRLSKDEYEVLFAEYDADGSGEIDLVIALFILMRVVSPSCAVFRTMGVGRSSVYIEFVLGVIFLNQRC